VLLKRRLSVLWAAAIMLLTILLASGAALAITGGTKDVKDPTTGKFKYPNVGALVKRAGAYCSGTLVPGKTDTPVFVTAAHCAPNRGNTVYVTFDNEYDAERTNFPDGTSSDGPPQVGKEYLGTFHADNINDIAVVTFNPTDDPDDPGYDPDNITLKDIPPNELAKLPDPNTDNPQVDLDFAAKGDPFTAVGYGATSGSSNDYGVRRYAVSTFKSVDRTYLRLSQHNGSAGTCYGDSGGPNFFGDVNETNVIAGITITGDTWCKSTNVTLRLDAGPVRAFLDDYVELP
jgi:secreted trypsin-like serine protease